MVTAELRSKETTETEGEGTGEAAHWFYKYYCALSAPGCLLKVDPTWRKASGEETEGENVKGGFTLLLDFGMRMVEAKQALLECLQVELRVASGLSAEKARPCSTLPNDAANRRRFLVYVEKTGGEKRRREQNKEKGKEKGSGKAAKEEEGTAGGIKGERQRQRQRQRQKGSW